MSVYSNVCSLNDFRKKFSFRMLSENVKEKKRFMIYGVEFVYLFAIGIAVSFIGWIGENTVKLISSSTIDSRFHILPFISPYALIPFALHIMLGDPDNIKFFGKSLFRKKSLKSRIASNFITYFVICTAVFLGEFLVGNLWEKFFGVKLWDYSNQPLHLTRYVSIFSALGYGTAAYFIFKFAVCPAIRILKRKDCYVAAGALCSTIGLWIVMDTFFMCLQIVLFRQAPMYWSISF